MELFPSVNPSKMFFDLSRRVIGVSLKINALVSSYIDLSKVLLITAIALSCLAFLGSLVLNNYLFVSISLTLCSVSAYAYKLHHDLNGSEKEQERLKSYIFDSNRIQKQHQEMSASIIRLEGISSELTNTNQWLRTKFLDSLELVKVCEKTMDVVRGKIDSSSVEVVKELESYKEVIGLWLKETETGFVKQEKVIETGFVKQEKVIEGAAQKVIHLLSTFSTDQHLALDGMFQQLHTLEEKIDFSRQILDVLESSIKTATTRLEEMHLGMQSSAKEICAGLQANTTRLEEVHLGIQSSAKEICAGLQANTTRLEEVHLGIQSKC